MSDRFHDFQERIKELRNKAADYADKDEINKAIDVAEKAWASAAGAIKIAESEQVAAALRATQRSADVLAYNILFCDTSETSPQTLLNHIVKFQALEQVRSAFSPAAAIALEESVNAILTTKAIEE
jgi:hypothetical protein